MSSSLNVFEVLYALFEGFKIEVDKTKLREVFNAIDSDRNGTLSRAEFRRAAQLVTMTQSEEEFNALFDGIDKDNSGSIDFEEFVGALDSIVADRPSDSEDIETALVQVAWRRLSASESGARAFYNALMNDDAAASLEHISLERQSRMIFRMVGNSISGLSRPKALVKVLNKMGRRHLDFGVGPRAYSAVRFALISALRTELGDEFTPSVETAFRKKWRFIEDALNEGPVQSKL